MKSIDINDFLELPTFIMIAGTKTPKDAKANPLNMNSFLHFFFGCSEFSVLVVDENNKPLLVVRKRLGEISTCDYEYIWWEIETDESFDELNCDELLTHPEDNRTYEEYSYDYKAPPLPYIAKGDLPTYQRLSFNHQTTALSDIITLSGDEARKIFVSEYYDVYLGVE